MCVSALLAFPLGAARAYAELAPISSICVEADTGFVVSEQNADIPRPPASMIKLLHMLLVVEGVESGKWDLQKPILISKIAQGMGGTQVFLKQGDIWPLGDLMQAVAVASANDAALAVAEGLWGSEIDYLMAANTRARELGLLDTKVHSTNGLPPSPGEPFDQTTARDMALLARECLKHPLIAYWVSMKEYSLRPGDAPKSNTNKLLWRMPECDGLKTGFIRAAGFCITATAKRNNVRLISVVMGSPSKYGRFNLAQELMEDGFRRIRKERLVAAGAAVGRPIPVRNGNVSAVLLTAAEDVWVVTTDEDRDKLDIIVKQPEVIDHSISVGDIIGEIQVARFAEIIASGALQAPIAVTAPLQEKRRKHPLLR